MVRTRNKNSAVKTNNKLNTYVRAIGLVLTAKYIIFDRIKDEINDDLTCLST